MSLNELLILRISGLTSGENYVIWFLLELDWDCLEELLLELGISIGYYRI